jgi:hypothetical protein
MILELGLLLLAIQVVLLRDHRKRSSLLAVNRRNRGRLKKRRDYFKFLET